ncbi:MAG: hydrolase TatD, partial [Epsilonproteobacteria bacterium]
LYTTFVADKMSELSYMERAMIDRITTENAQRLFSI